MLDTISTKRIGDGKLPNKYWVSISNDYYACHNGQCDWISDTGWLEVKGKTIRIFNIYKQALAFVDNELPLGIDYNGIRVNSIVIEDRLSGEVYHKCYEIFIPSAESSETSTEDITFTKAQMLKQGKQFK